MVKLSDKWSEIFCCLPLDEEDDQEATGEIANILGMKLKKNIVWCSLLFSGLNSAVICNMSCLFMEVIHSVKLKLLKFHDAAVPSNKLYPEFGEPQRYVLLLHWCSTFS